MGMRLSSAHSRASGNQGPLAVTLGPRNGVPATRASRGAPRGYERIIANFSSNAHDRRP
jgi:hypothetical protein